MSQGKNANICEDFPKSINLLVLMPICLQFSAKFPTFPPPPAYPVCPSAGGCPAARLRGPLRRGGGRQRVRGRAPRAARSGGGAGRAGGRRGAARHPPAGGEGRLRPGGRPARRLAERPRLTPPTVPNPAPLYPLPAPPHPCLEKAHSSICLASADPSPAMRVFVGPLMCNLCCCAAST